MPGVVRVEVEHGVDEFTASDYQTILVGQLRNIGEWFLTFPVVPLHRRFGQIGHPVRGPQPLQMVAFADAPVDDGVISVVAMFFLTHRRLLSRVQLWERNSRDRKSTSRWLRPRCRRPRR